MQPIIGTNNAALILAKQIVKPSEPSDVFRVPYAVKTLLGWAVINLLLREQREVSPYSAFKVYERRASEDDELKQLVVAQSEVEALGVMKLINPTRFD